MNVKRCVVCGAPMPRGASRKGWTIVRVFEPGKGTRYYRHCGYCSSDDFFYEYWHRLFDNGRDYPDFLPTAYLLFNRVDEEKGDF